MGIVTQLLGEPSDRRSPRVLQQLTRSKWAAPVWTAARIWLGVMWIQAGVAKLWGDENPGFLHHSGAAVLGFATHGYATAGVASYSWWASFLHSFVVPNAGWIAVFVAFAEFIAGIALALGLLTPIAAGGALLLNVIYMFSGVAGVNPLYAIFAVVILATWRTSGWIGIDGLIQGYLERRRGHRHLVLHKDLTGTAKGVQAA